MWLRDNRVCEVKRNPPLWSMGGFCCATLTLQMLRLGGNYGREACGHLLSGIQ
jgi:hypothetical protein